MAQKEVTVYTKPSCVQCDATKRWLDANGYKDAYEVDDAIENLDHIRALLNFQQAPVIRVLDPETKSLTFWFGHNPIELEKHLKLVVPAAA